MAANLPDPEPTTLLKDVLHLGAEHDAGSTQTHETEKDPTSDGDPLLGSLATRSRGLVRHQRQHYGRQGISAASPPP